MFFLSSTGPSPSTLRLFMPNLPWAKACNKAIMNWLIDNHPSYCNMTRPECAPNPVVLGGFEETINNTDESDGSDSTTENKIDTEQMTFAPRHEPSESIGPYQNEKQFIFSQMKGENPTLLFRSGDYI